MNQFEAISIEGKVVWVHIWHPIPYMSATSSLLIGLCTAPDPCAVGNTNNGLHRDVSPGTAPPQPLIPLPSSAGEDTHHAQTIPHISK